MLTARDYFTVTNGMLMSPRRYIVARLVVGAGVAFRFPRMDIFTLPMAHAIGGRPTPDWEFGH